LTRVLGTLIAAAIISLVIYFLPGGWRAVFSWLGDAWGFVWGIVCACAAWCWNALVSFLTYPLPLWLILSSVIVATAILSARDARRRRRAARAQQQQHAPGLPEPLTIAEDPLLPTVFHHLKWIENHGKLVPTCPTCGLEIRPRHYHGGVFPMGPTRYECERCGPIATYDKTHHELLDLLVRDLERRSRLPRAGA
jgi:hypothetical protein